MLAYQQNIVVTVPANTRFYLVLHEAAVTRSVAPRDPGVREPEQWAEGAGIQQTSTGKGISEQELREMIQLRNELREMNRLMQLTAPKGEPTTLENR